MLNKVMICQVDTGEEVAREINKIVDEVNLLRVDVDKQRVNSEVQTETLSLILAKPKSKPKAKPKVKTKKKNKKKGNVLMKTLVSLVVLAVILFSTVCLGQEQWPITYDTVSTPNQLVQLLTNRFSNQSGNYFTFGPTTTAPGHSAGRVYYHTVNGLYVSDGTAWDAIDTAGGLSLDGAYDLGNTITVDGSAVTLTAGAATVNGVLTLVQSNTGAYECLKITNAGTDPSIEIDGSGTGDDITGTGDLWTVSEAGAGTFVGLSIGNGDIALTEPGNDVGIRADESDQIEFFNASENVSLGFATSDTLEWHTDSSIATVAWGDLDAHTGLTDITGDATDFTISHTGNVTGYDLLITQSGSGDNALTLTSGGTASDAIGLVSSAGITMTSTVEASSWTQTATGTDDDLTIALAGALDASLILSSAGTGADALSIFTSHANGDIKILSTDTIDIDAANGIAIDIAGSSGQDYALTNTGGSIVLSATEDAADAINIDATAGGIDIDAVGEAGQDIVITNTGGSINLIQTEAVDDGLNIDTTGGIDVDSTLAIVLTSVEDTADSIVLQSTLGGIDILCDAGASGDDIDIANTGGSVNITSSEATDGAIKLQTSNATGQLLFVVADTTSDAIEIDNSGGFEMDCVDIIAIDNSGSTKDITITSALGRVVLTGTESADSAVEIVADGTAGGVTIDAKTSGITLTATGGDVTVTNTTAKDIIIDAQAGRVLITGTEDAADAILLTADGAGGEIAMTAKTGGIDIDAVGGTINLDTSGAGIDILLDATEGAVGIDGGETGANAIVINASHSGGGINADFGSGGFSLVGASGDIVMTVAGDASDVITLTTTTGTGTAAIGLVATAGGVEIDAAAGKILALDGGQVTIASKTAQASAITITSAIGAADTIIVTNTAGTAVTDGAEAIQLIATAGGIGLHAVNATAGGPAATYENAAAITLLSDSGAISLHTEGNIEKAIQLVTDGGVDESIFLKVDQGTDANSIELVSDVGGIKLNAPGLVGNSAIQIVSGGGGVDIDAKEMFTVDVAGGTVGTADITLTNNVGTNNACIALTTTSGGIDINAKEMLTLDVAAGTAGTADIIITNTPGTAADAIYLNAVAGGMKLHVPDGKELIMGHIGDDTYVKVAPHGTAATEIISVVNAAGTADGAIVLTSTAGGVDINVKEMFTVDVSGGTAADCDIILTNATGTDNAAIALIATVGGVDINAKELFTVDVSGGTAGTADIILTNSVGTSDDSIEITSTTGGIDINAKSMLTLDVAAGTAGTTLITITNTPGTDDAAIAVDAVAGGIDIEAAKSIHITSEESANDAIYLHASAGGIDITAASGGGGEDIDIITTGNTDNHIKIISSGTTADALKLQASAGGIDIDGGAGGDITVDTSKSILLTSTEAVSDSIGLTAAGNITLTTTDAAGILINTATYEHKVKYFPIGKGLVEATALTIGGGTPLTCVGLGTGADEVGSTEGFVLADTETDYIRFGISLPDDWVDTGLAADLIFYFDVDEQATEAVDVSVKIYVYEGYVPNTTAIVDDDIDMADDGTRKEVTFATLTSGIGAEANLDAGDYLIFEMSGDAAGDDYKLYGIKMVYRCGLAATQ